MSDRSTLTIRLPNETKAKLERLVGHTRRTRNALVDEALTTYVDRELATIKAIERGREEIRAGCGLDTEEVFRDVEAAITEVEANRGRP